MLRLALKSIRANFGRLVATLVAITIGVGFLASGRMLTDAVASALRATSNREYAQVSAVVRAADSSETGAETSVPAAAVPAIAGVPGVEAAAGRVSGSVAPFADGRRSNERATGRNWVADPALNPLTIETGRPPGAEAEIVVDRGLADELGVATGSTLDLATSAGVATFAVVGTSRAAEADTLDGGGTISFTDESAFRYLTSGDRGFTDVLVRGEPGTDEVALVRAIDSVVPPGTEVVTGDEFRKEQGDLVASLARAISPALQAFGFLTLFVCGFVIYNTFSVVIAQRRRELALLRAIGATPRQVRRSVRLEGLAVGVIGSVAGLASGVVFAKGLQLALDRFGIDLPGSGVSVSLRTVVICAGFGTLITVLSVMPAGRRAARTAPVEAMRDAQIEAAGVHPARRAFGLILVGGGALVLVLATVTDLDFRLVGMSVLGFLLGLFVAGPAFAYGLGVVFRRPLAAIGFPGRLADDALARSPRRASTTANALVIGVLLVTLITVCGSAIRTWAVDEVNKLSTADFTLQTDGGSLPATVLEQTEALPGVTAVAPVTVATAEIDGVPSVISAGDPARLQDAAGVTVRDGDLGTLADGEVAVLGLGGEQLGAVIDVRTETGETVPLRVAAIIEPSIAGLELLTLVTPNTFVRIAGPQVPQSAYVRVDPGSYDDVHDALDRIVAPYSNVTLGTGNDLGELVDALFTFLIDAINGLLLFAIVVALVGIVNTLSLAIIERRREFALLRAVGMTPRQVRSSVRIESLLIAGLGTMIGVGAGSLLGFAAISALGIGDPIGSIAWGRVALVTVGGVIVGVLAALVPAWRATRIDLLEALRAT